MINVPPNAYVGSEDNFQVSAINIVRRIVRSAGFITECAMHVPNGGARSKVVGAKMKAAGVVRGYPDIMVFAPGRDPDRCGLALELKIWPNKPTLDQLFVHEILRDAGWHVLTCWSLDSVISATNEHFAK